MGNVFSVELPYGFDASTFEVLDVEPDIDGVDWIEEEPALPDGSANLYVYNKSTVGIALHLDEEFEVWVPALASQADWQLAFGVLQRSADLFETIFVTWNDGDVWELSELEAHCGSDWQIDQQVADTAALKDRVEIYGTVAVKGPMRTTHIGRSVLAEVGAGSVTIAGVLLRTNFVGGPHLVGHAETDDDQLVSVLGPGLRTLLPPSDAVLLDTIDLSIPPVVVRPEVLDDLSSVGVISVVRLDEGHRLVGAVAETAWSTVLRAALPNAVPGR